MLRLYFGLFCLLLTTLAVHAQQTPKSTIQSIYASYKKNNLVVDSIGKSKANFYKKHISHQISASCEFHQSCSVFMSTAIQFHGFASGFLLGIDRLSRCGASEGTYNYLPSMRWKQDNTLLDELPFYE